MEWPDTAKGRILICVAGQNPFGTLLESMVRNERVHGVPLVTEVILEGRADCDVLFTPKTAAIPVYLRAVAGMPTLTIGETPGFVEQGGMIGFYPEASTSSSNHPPRPPAHLNQLRRSTREVVEPHRRR